MNIESNELLSEDDITKPGGQKYMTNPDKFKLKCVILSNKRRFDKSYYKIKIDNF